MGPGAGGLGGRARPHGPRGPAWRGGDSGQLGCALPKSQEPAGVQSSLCIWGTRVSTRRGGGGFLGSLAHTEGPGSWMRTAAKPLWHLLTPCAQLQPSAALPWALGMERPAMYSWQGLPVMGWAEPDAPGREPVGPRAPGSAWGSRGALAPLLLCS